MAGTVKKIVIGSLIILAVEGFYFRVLRPPVKVLGKEEIAVSPPENSPAPTPTEEPTPSPSASPVAVPTPVPTPVPKPQPQFTPEEINGFIDRFAAQYNVSPHVLRHIALCESSFDPAAYYVGYGGLYQFGKITWRNSRLKMGEDPDPDLRYNAEEAVQTAAFNIQMGKLNIWPNCAPK